MSTQVYPVARKENIVVQELKGEFLVYDLIDNKALCLNEASSQVWNLCDGSRSADDMCEELSGKLKTKVPRDYVWLALSQLKENKLLSGDAKVEAKFEGESRRQVIKKIGLASTLALPFVASIVAPTVALAQSCAGVGGMCTSVANCCSPLACGNDFAGGLHCCNPPGGSCTFPLPALCCSGCCTSVGAPPGQQICC